MTVPMTAVGRIALDMLQGVPPEVSVLSYTEEMREYRDIVERQWAEMKRKEPDAIFDVSWIETEDGWISDED